MAWKVAGKGILVAVFIAASAIVHTPTAGARIMQIAAITTERTALQFLKDGEKVCRFSLIYYDNLEPQGISARLLRVLFTLGQPDPPVPTVMAELNSTGAKQKVRRKSTTDISNRTIDTKRAFYMLEMEVLDHSAQTFGVQLDLRSDCH